MFFYSSKDSPLDDVPVTIVLFDSNWVSMSQLSRFSRSLVSFGVSYPSAQLNYLTVRLVHNSTDPHAH